MPDRDVIPRAPVGLWKRPYDHLCSGADVKPVCQEVSRSLITSLKKKGGLPGAQNLADITKALIEKRIDLPQALEQVREVEWEHKGHVHTRVAAQAVNGLLVEISQGLVIETDPLKAVVQRFCPALVHFQLLDRYGPDKQGLACATYEEYRNWENSILDPLGPQFEIISSTLASDLSGRSLPRQLNQQRPARPSTASMLDTDLL